MNLPHLYAPFVGVLVLPDSRRFKTDAPVSLDGGVQIAVIRRHSMSMSGRFDILDSQAATVLGAGGREGLWTGRYAVADPGGGPILGVQFSVWTPGRATATLPTGVQLRARGNRLTKNYSISDTAGTPIAQLASTTRVRDSFVLELGKPLLTILQAIALAQCIRGALKTSRTPAAPT